MRRALGFKLVSFGYLLFEFVGYLEDEGLGHVTIESALTWAIRPAGASAGYAAMRLGVARQFAKHLRCIDPATEVPPADLLPRGKRRTQPYLYSDTDITALIQAAATIPTPLRAVTYQALIALLSVTGMRVGEAIRLDIGDLDSRRGVLTIRDTKFGKSREVPLHPTTVDALCIYVARRDRPPSSPSLFVSMNGTRLCRNIIEVTFGHLARQAGLEPRSANCRPRVHDVRHSFAVRTLLEWYRRGLDVQARLPLLSTFLGHVDPRSTYWYLSATPELLGLAGQRLEHALGDLR